MALLERVDDFGGGEHLLDCGVIDDQHSSFVSWLMIRAWQTVRMARTDPGDRDLKGLASGLSQAASFGVPALLGFAGPGIAALVPTSTALRPYTKGHGAAGAGERIAGRPGQAGRYGRGRPPALRPAPSLPWSETGCQQVGHRADGLPVMA